MSDLPIRLMPFLVPCIVLYYWFSYPCGVYRVCEEIRHGGSPAGAWRTAIIVQWVQYEWLFGGWSSGHGAITSGLCCVHLPLLPSTAHLYSYQQRYCESLNHFNIHDFLSSLFSFFVHLYMYHFYCFEFVLGLFYLYYNSFCFMPCDKDKSGNAMFSLSEMVIFVFLVFLRIWIR